MKELISIEFNVSAGELSSVLLIVNSSIRRRKDAGLYVPDSLYSLLGTLYCENTKLIDNESISQSDKR